MVVIGVMVVKVSAFISKKIIINCTIQTVYTPQAPKSKEFALVLLPWSFVVGDSVIYLSAIL